MYRSCCLFLLYVCCTYSRYYMYRSCRVNVQELLYFSAVHLWYMQRVLYVQKMYIYVQELLSFLLYVCCTYSTYCMYRSCTVNVQELLYFYAVHLWYMQQVLYEQKMYSYVQELLSFSVVQYFCCIYSSYCMYRSCTLAAVFLCCTFVVYAGSGTLYTEDVQLCTGASVHFMYVQHILYVQKMYTKCTLAAVFICCTFAVYAAGTVCTEDVQ